MKNYCENCDDFVDIEIKIMEETYNVKGEAITFDTEVAFCKECSQKVFNQELDNKTLNTAYSIYRKNHNLLTPAEIINIREKYRLSQRALARLLEWGEITIHRYETGAIQDAVHNEVLMLIDNPKNMKTMVDRNGHLLSASALKKLKERLENQMKNEACSEWINSLKLHLSANDKYNEYSGFAPFNYDKVKNMILFLVANSKDVFKTKLNKMLFYSDFLTCKEYSHSISGNSYVHLPYGPVPHEYDWILASMTSEGSLQEEEKYFPNGISGTVFNNVDKLDKSIFTKHELGVLKYVASYFKDYTSEQIKNLSHQEKAYQETEELEKISYKYAKDLSISLKNG